eukprot:Trichotokara_eunicae@DN3916_c0_g1_i1.p1
MNYRETKNLPPGTMIVDGLTAIGNFKNFYLISHAGLKGTSNPSRYHVLYDDFGYSEEAWASLAYHLCYVFGRAQRAVSIPTPVYYAHMVSERCSIVLANAPELIPEDAEGRLKAANDALRSLLSATKPMFYC